MSSRVLLPLLTAASFTFLGCSSDSATQPRNNEPPPIPVLSVAGGTGQSAAPGSTLPVAPTVMARTLTGAAAAGVRVTFVVTGGGGHLASATAQTVITDAGGRASVAWTLGATPGENTLGVFLTDAPEATPLLFTATAVAVRIRSIELMSLSNAGEVDTFLSAPVATVTDANGDPAAGVTVTFRVLAGGGTITGAVRVTDADGRARLGSWRLGTVSGPQTIAADAPDYTTALLTVQALAAAPVALDIVAGADQTATVTSRVPVAPAVKLVDRFGNGVPRAGIAFRVDGRNSTFVLTPYETTDANGIARTGGWHLGLRPGTYMLAVSSLATPALAVTFTATAVAGPPAALRPIEGDRQSAPAGSKLNIDPAVQVTDNWGNPLAIAGIVVVFTPRGQSGTVTSHERETDANGVARVGWRIGSLIGPDVNLLTAEAAGLRATSFRATGQ